MFRVFKVILALTQLATALRHLHSLGPSRTETLSPKNVVRIYNRQSLLDMDQFGRVRYGLLWTQVLEPPFVPPEALVRDAATGRVRVRAFSARHPAGPAAGSTWPVNRRRGPFLALETLRSTPGRSA